MAVVSLTSSPSTLDAGTSETVSVTNTGTVAVTVTRGSQVVTLQPTQLVVVYPEGTAVTALVASGSGQVTTSVTSKPLPNAADPATLAANAAFTSTYAQLWISPAASTTLTGTLAAWIITAVDCTAGAGARTLPAASSVTAGTAVCAKKADTSANALVVSRAGSDLIYGTGSGTTSKTLSLSGEAVEFVSNGVDKWTVRASDTPSGALATTYLTQASATSTYAPITGSTVYVPSAGFLPSKVRRLRAGLAKARTTNGYLRLGFCGDSTTKGTGAANTTWSWPRQIAALLAGPGYPFAGDLGYNNSSSGITDSRWTFGAGWAAYSGDSVKANLYSTNTNASVATYASTETGTAVDVHYLNNSTRTFTVAIDGGSAVTVTPSGGSTFGTYTVTGLSNATHSVVITAGTGGNTLYLVGATVRATNGVLVANAGNSGTQTGDWANSSTWYFQANQLLSWAPDVVFIMLGINDLAGSVANATTLTNLTTICNFYSAASDVILVIPQPANARASDTIQADYLSTATALGLPYIDIYARWGTFASANTLGMTFDGDHPNTPGYSDVAAAVLRGMLTVAA